jgi:cell division protein FtsL
VITTIVTFLSTRIVSVIITTVVVVAAVPTLIVAIHGNTITITSGPVASASRTNGDNEHARLVLEVKAATDNVVVKLNDEEASCDSQIAQLAAVSRLSGTATQAAIDKGKGEFHNSELPLLNEVKADEDEFDHLTTVTSETEQTFLVRISTVQVTALGEDGHSGTLVTVCQTILVEIRTIVVTVVIQPQPPKGGEGDDAKVKV